MQNVVVREALAGRQGGLEGAFRELENTPASSIGTLARSDCTLVSARFDVPQTHGRGYWEFLSLGQDLFGIVSNAQYAQTMQVPVAGEDWIEFHFRLSGELKLVEGQNRIDVSNGTLLIWRQPRGVDIIEHFSFGGAQDTSVTFYCRPSFFSRHFGEAVASFEHDLAEVTGEQCAQIKALHAVLYPALTRLLVEFASPSVRRGLHLVKAENLAIQIIGEVLANVSFQQTRDCQTLRLSDRDVDCLRNAREILVAQHAPPPTIEEIARRVGMSGTKLKSGFRSLFGQTVADYANDLRMTAAKDLLRKSDRPIAQVSAELGYEYQNSFTVAFRRKWGILPKDYRRNPLAFEQQVCLT